MTLAYVRPRSIPLLHFPRSRFARIARADLPFAAPSPSTKRFITTKHHGASPARCAPSHTRPAQLRRTQCICLVAPKRLDSHPSHRPCPLFCGRRRRRGLQHVDEAHGPSSSGSSSSIRWRRLQRQWQEQQQQWSSPPQGGAGSPGSSISRSSNSIVSHRRGAWPAAAAAAAATAVDEQRYMRRCSGQSLGPILRPHAIAAHAEVLISGRTAASQGYARGVEQQLGLGCTCFI